jgi:hypothetical protein
MFLLYLLGIKIHPEYTFHSYIYIFFIFTLFIYNISINNNINIIYKTIQIITQYLCSLFYLRNNYIYNTFICRPNIKLCIEIFAIIFLCLSIIYNVIEILYIKNCNTLIHNIIFNIIFNLYGINIILNNFLILYIIFIKVLQDLLNIHTNIKNNNLDNSIKDIINIKFTLSAIMTEIECVFGSFTFCGTFILVIGSIYYDDSSFNRNFYYFCISFQVILQLIGHIIFISINHFRKNIYGQIHSKVFVNKFIIKLNREKLEQIFNMEIIHEYTNELILNSVEDNFKSIEWLIYNKILESHWITFSFMGFDIHNLDFIKKTILGISIIYYIIHFVL